MRVKEQALRLTFRAHDDELLKHICHAVIPSVALPTEKRPGTHCTGVSGARAGLGGYGKFRPHQVRTTDRPSRGESPYRLRYSGRK